MLVISTDGIEGAIQMKELVGAEFPVLADPSRDVVIAYGVVDLLGDGVAAPAAYIIGKDGTILWSYVGADIADRPSAAQILSVLAGLVGP